MIMKLYSMFCVMHLPALVMIISVPISWNRFHKSEPCRSTRISSPELVPDCTRTCEPWDAGCGLSNNTSSDSAEKDRKKAVLIILYFNYPQETFNLNYCCNNDCWSGTKKDLRWFSDSHALPGSLHVFTDFLYCNVVKH